MFGSVAFVWQQRLRIVKLEDSINNFGKFIEYNC